MNRALLVGRLTKDPELRTTTSGMAITRFTIAVSEPFTNKNGERETNFISCSTFNKQAENVAKYCHKGSLVSAEGRIRTGSYDAQDGTKRYTTEVVCDRINFLSSKTGNEPSMNDNNFMPNDDMSAMETADLSEDPFKSFGEEITLSSDDLPF